MIRMNPPTLLPPHLCFKHIYKSFQTQAASCVSLVLDSNKHFGFYGLNPELIIEWGGLWAPAQDQRLVYYAFVHAVCKQMIGTPQSRAVTEQTMSIFAAQEWQGIHGLASNDN